MREYPREIPVTEMRPGLTIWKPDQGKFVRECYLQDYFLGGWEIPPSIPPRVFARKLEFLTSSGQLFTWHPCGTVYATFGKDDRKQIKIEGHGNG